MRMHIGKTGKNQLVMKTNWVWNQFLSHMGNLTEWIYDELDSGFETLTGPSPIGFNCLIKKTKSFKGFGHIWGEDFDLKD